MTFASIVQIQSKCMCTQSSSTIHLQPLEETDAVKDHEFPLTFEVYYDQPIYPTQEVWWEKKRKLDKPIATHYVRYGYY
jgi:hypothetical protein